MYVKGGLNVFWTRLGDGVMVERSAKRQVKKPISPNLLHTNWFFSSKSTWIAPTLPTGPLSDYRKVAKALWAGLLRIFYFDGNNLRVPRQAPARPLVFHIRFRTPSWAHSNGGQVHRRRERICSSHKAYWKVWRCTSSSDTNYSTWMFPSRKNKIIFWRQKFFFSLVDNYRLCCLELKQKLCIVDEHARYACQFGQFDSFRHLEDNRNFALIFKKSFFFQIANYFIDTRLSRTCSQASKKMVQIVQTAKKM